MIYGLTLNAAVTRVELGRPVPMISGLTLKAAVTRRPVPMISGLTLKAAVTRRPVPMIRGIVLNVAVTSVVLGALQQNGVVKCKPEVFKYDMLQKVFTTVVNLGELVYVQSIDLVESISKNKS
eukprot:gene19208-25826_t